MSSFTNCSVMWGGVCHSIAYDDARRLVRAGMAEPSRRASGSYDGIVFATTEYRTPHEALAFIARGQGGAAALKASASRPGSFLPVHRPSKQPAKPVTGRRARARAR